MDMSHQMQYVCRKNSKGNTGAWWRKNKISVALEPTRVPNMPY